MAPYPETETMTLKRIEVAIKKRDWSLLSEGIMKIREKFEINHRWELSTQWRELLLQAEEAKLPEELWKSFCSVISKVLGNDDIISVPENDELSRVVTLPVSSSDNSGQITANLSDSAGQKQLSFPSDNKKDEIILSASFPVKEESVSLSSQDLPAFKESFSVFYNEDIDEQAAEMISSYRNGLNSLMEKNSTFSPSKSWYENLAYLVNLLNKPNSQMIEFLNGIKGIKSTGTVISAGYSASVVQTMLKSGISLSIPSFKESDKTDNSFKYIALGGIISSFVCPSCGTRILKTGSHFEAVTGCCKKCAGMTYPDICDISSNQSLSSPKVWYSAFNSMVNSRVWILVNPPYHTKSQVEDFLSFAVSEAVALQRVYIISKNAETSSFWRSIFENSVPSVEIKDNYQSISALLNDFKNIEIKTPVTI